MSLRDGRRVAAPLGRAIGIAILLVVSGAGSAPSTPPAADPADGWISHPLADASRRPVVLHFRRELDLGDVPRSMPVDVTADTNFVLYVNGRRAGSGPSTSDVAHWRTTRIELGPLLRRGRNSLVATVWNFVRPPVVASSEASLAERGRAYVEEMFGQTGRLAQQSISTGFRLDGHGPAEAISTRNPGWQVAIDAGRSATSGARQVGLGRYYVAGAPEIVDTRIAIDPASGAGTGTWSPAIAAPAAVRPLTLDPLPAQTFVEVPSGDAVRVGSADDGGFPARPITIPAHGTATILIRRDAMISAYPELSFSGGRDAKIAITYAEALYDLDGRKGDRDEIAGRRPIGITDAIVADGGPHMIMPLWWRTWRYLQISIETGDTPLRLERLRTFETGYPFVAQGFFRSDDPALDRIWQIGWRTALVDAHDTYMDTAYWEQLQYVGDTRLQALISYAVAGDPRLARQAIDAFAASNADGGLVEGAWPSRGSNVIAPFSFLWIGMLHDWWSEQPNSALVANHLDRMRDVIAWFRAWQGPDGLLRRNPQWNFTDWVGQSAADRSVFPSYSRTGESCLMSVQYLGALRQAAEIERALGDRQTGEADARLAATLAVSIRARCYVVARGLYADNPDRAVFSQQMNALAVLYDVATPREARAILGRIVTPGRGIDAPPGLFGSSYYFAWYLVRAFEHAGLADSYPQLLVAWRNLLPLHFTTWPEERGDTRSDSHAWSAHPTADLLRLVAGIGPGGPGYRSLRVAPHLGALKRLDAAAATPRGPVQVRYRIHGHVLHAKIHRPDTLPGWFEWAGRRYPLLGVTTTLRVPVS